MRQIFVATIQVAVSAACDAQACDAVAETLRTCVDRDIFLGWQYLKLGGQLTSPTSTFVSKENYDAGEYFL